MNSALNLILAQLRDASGPTFAQLCPRIYHVSRAKNAALILANGVQL